MLLTELMYRSFYTEHWILSHFCCQNPLQDKNDRTSSLHKSKSISARYVPPFTERYMRCNAKNEGSPFQTNLQTDSNGFTAMNLGLQPIWEVSYHHSSTTVFLVWSPARVALHFMWCGAHCIPDEKWGARFSPTLFLRKTRMHHYVLVMSPVYSWFK